MNASSALCVTWHCVLRCRDNAAVSVLCKHVQRGDDFTLPAVCVWFWWCCVIYDAAVQLTEVVGAGRPLQSTLNIRTWVGEKSAGYLTSFCVMWSFIVQLTFTVSVCRMKTASRSGRNHSNLFLQMFVLYKRQIIGRLLVFQWEWNLWMICVSHSELLYTVSCSCNCVWVTNCCRNWSITQQH